MMIQYLTVLAILSSRSSQGIPTPDFIQRAIPSSCSNLKYL